MLTRGFLLAGALALSGCALDPQGGYRPLAERSGSPQAMSFNQANAECWQLSMSLLGGFAMDSSRQRAYDTCMNDRGWYDPRLPTPQPRGVTTPSGR